jgi:hypothetical protein
MLELLLKQLGINASEMKAQIENAPAQLQQLINHFNNRLDDIEKKQNEILKLLKPDTHLNLKD